MDLITPGFGLVFWSTLFFLMVLILLKIFAWKPILQGINEREKTIDDALRSAERAREEMANLKAENEEILKQAKAERDGIIQEAREIREKMIDEAKGQAEVEAKKMVAAARLAIDQERTAALNTIKDQVASLSLDIATRVIQKELQQDAQQQQLVEDLVKDIKLS